MVRRVSVAQYESAVLLGLHKFAIEQQDPFVLLDDAPNVIGCGGQLTATCIDGLVKQNFLEKLNWAGRPAIRLTRNGFEAVDSWSDEQYSKIKQVLAAEDEGLDNGLYLDGGQIPASDRTVNLNHNQPDYKEAVAALDKVIKEFRNDHRLDNDLGHEKGALLKALEGGRELLNDTVVNVRIGTALLIEPLQRLVVKYEKELVAALASAAIPLILKIFGLG